MAEFVKWFGLILMACAQIATAQTLNDPTRPANLQLSSMATQTPDAGPVLQSILIAPNRQLAIISGETVALHGHFGDATLVRLSETEVVLKRGKQLQTLKLFPDLKKRSVSEKANVDPQLKRPQRQ